MYVCMGSYEKETFFILELLSFMSACMNVYVHCVCM